MTMERTKQNEVVVLTLAVQEDYKDEVKVTPYPLSKMAEIYSEKLGFKVSIKAMKAVLDILGIKRRTKCKEESVDRISLLENRIAVLERQVYNLLRPKED